MLREQRIAEMYGRAATGAGVENDADEEVEVERELGRQESLATSWILRMLDLWSLVSRGTIYPDHEGGGERVVYKIGSWAPLLRLAREWPYSQDAIGRTMRTMKTMLFEMNRPSGELLVFHSQRLEQERLAAVVH